MANAPDALVRERRAGDLEAAAQALVAVHAADGYPVEGVDDPVAWLTPPTLIRAWVAELGGQVVGHLALSTPASGDDAARLWREQNPQSTDELAVLGRLFVTSAARGRAVGKRLARTALAHAADENLLLVLDVMEKDRAAISLYERLGWRRIGEATHRFGKQKQVRAFCYVAPS